MVGKADPETKKKGVKKRKLKKIQGMRKAEGGTERRRKQKGDMMRRRKDKRQ